MALQTQLEPSRACKPGLRSVLSWPQLLLCTATKLPPRPLALCSFRTLLPWAPGCSWANSLSFPGAEILAGQDETSSAWWGWGWAAPGSMPLPAGPSAAALPWLPGHGKGPWKHLELGISCLYPAMHLLCDVNQKLLDLECPRWREENVFDSIDIRRLIIIPCYVYLMLWLCYVMVMFRLWLRVWLWLRLLYVLCYVMYVALFYIYYIISYLYINYI